MHLEVAESSPGRSAPQPNATASRALLTSEYLLLFVRPAVPQVQLQSTVQQRVLQYNEAVCGGAAAQCKCGAVAVVRSKRGATEAQYNNVVQCSSECSNSSAVQ